MNRFAAHKSILLLVLAWVMVIALFADGANLDDLISGVVVIHDDDQVVQQLGGDLTASADHNVSAQPVPAPGVPVRAARSTPLPVVPVRIVVDQDSPSLAAEWRKPESFIPLPGSGGPVPVQRSSEPRDSLYLRFCALLI